MIHNLEIPLIQAVALMDAAVVVIDVKSLQVEYVSPRAIELLETNDRVPAPRSLPDIVQMDSGRILSFVQDAASVSSPIVTAVRRASDGSSLTVKAQRVPSASTQPLIALFLSGDTELGRRFRSLTEKINALNHEVDQRRRAEADLLKIAADRYRTLMAVRQISELDTGDSSYLSSGLAIVAAACDCRGAGIIGSDLGKPIVSAVSGLVADTHQVNDPIHLPIALSEILALTDGQSTNILRESLGGGRQSPDSWSNMQVFPLSCGGARKSCLIVLDLGASSSEVEILSEALSGLMNRATAEADLRHAQKLQAIGELTGGIAHDFNNILAVILGNAELMLDEAGRFGLDSIEAELARAVRDAALRGATLTSRLLSFARKQPLQPESRPPNVILRDLDGLLRRAAGPNVNLEIVVGGGVWNVRLDQSQFENAMLNLVLNARDAMPNGGRLTVETANTRLDSEYATQHREVKPGQYVMVAVTDTGLGMTPDVAREAFTPFFTTKGVGKGSGLGLSMVYGFVKQSGGHIKIYSEAGHGTTVKLYFPRDSSFSEAPTSHELRSNRVGSGSNHSVLLVEDDPDILRYAEKTLVLLGYSVDTALTGDRAMELLHSHSYDILLTDVILPNNVNGADLARLASSLSPKTKVLFMSGYTENSIVHNGQLDAGVELISKPFTRDQLAQRLARIVTADT